jgi:hypothetical protein
MTPFLIISLLLEYFYEMSPRHLHSQLLDSLNRINFSQHRTSGIPNLVITTLSLRPAQHLYKVGARVINHGQCWHENSLSFFISLNSPSITHLEVLGLINQSLESPVTCLIHILFIHQYIFKQDTAMAAHFAVG